MIMPFFLLSPIHEKGKRPGTFPFWGVKIGFALPRNN